MHRDDDVDDYDDVDDGAAAHFEFDTWNLDLCGRMFATEHMNIFCTFCPSRLMICFAQYPNLFCSSLTLLVFASPFLIIERSSVSAK